MLKYNVDKRTYQIDGVEIKDTELLDLNSDLGVAVATWRRLRRETQILDDILEETNKTIDIVDRQYVAVVCRLRELHSIGRHKRRPA